MSARIIKHLACLGLLPLMLTSCYRPPFNNFKPDPRPIGPSSISPQLREKAIVQQLRRQAIEFIQYGDQRTLLIPTDRYFVFDTPHLNDICYAGLNNIVQLIKGRAYCTIYVAGFSDNVGTRYHKDKLSQARAEAMLTFLWANNIPAESLKAEGYGEQHAIGDNRFIHASAYNRRLEIQWTLKDPKLKCPETSGLIPAEMMTK